MAGIRDIVIDALDPPRLARFWAQALDGYSVRAYDSAELDRLAALGLTPDTDPAVALDGPGPTIFLQLTHQTKTARNRAHLDLGCVSPADEVERLQKLGAQIRDVCADHTVMLDPEGNEFCVRHP